jgi:hypothetical protein
MKTAAENEALEWLRASARSSNSRMIRTRKELLAALIDRLELTVAESIKPQAIHVSVPTARMNEFTVQVKRNGKPHMITLKVAQREYHIEVGPVSVHTTAKIDAAATPDGTEKHYVLLPGDSFRITLQPSTALDALAPKRQIKGCKG